MIKFRAWDKVAKIMIYNIEQTYDGLGYFQENEDIEDYVSDISFGCFADWLENDQFVIMQSTGLKDKNGVEIFEGDVVKCCRLFNDSLSEYVGQVKFVDFGWNIVDKADTHDPFYNYKDGFPDEIREIEVIGNIYQNSDLLESVEE